MRMRHVLLLGALASGTAQVVSTAIHGSVGWIDVGLGFAPLAIFGMTLAGGEAGVWVANRHNRKLRADTDAEDRILRQTVCAHNDIVTMHGVKPGDTYRVSTYDECQQCGMIDPPLPARVRVEMGARASADAAIGSRVEALSSPYRDMTGVETIGYGSHIYCDHEYLRQQAVFDMTTRELCVRCGERRWHIGDGVWRAGTPQHFLTPMIEAAEAAARRDTAPVQPVAPVVHRRRPLNLDG